MKNEILNATFGIGFAFILVVAATEVFFRIVPDLLPREFSYIKYVTYDSVVGSKLKPNYETNIRTQDGISYTPNSRYLHIKTLPCTMYILYYIQCICEYVLIENNKIFPLFSILLVLKRKNYFLSSLFIISS